MRTRRLATWMVMIGLVVVAMVAPVSAADTVKLAVMEPLSGTFKDIGDRYLEGVQYAAEVLNANGGINGQKVEVIPVDSELKPAIATTKATKLILTEKVKYFCGGTGSSVAGAMEVLAQKHSLIFYTYGMAAASLTGEKMQPEFLPTVRQHRHPVGSTGPLGGCPGVQEGRLYRPGITRSAKRRPPDSSKRSRNSIPMHRSSPKSCIPPATRTSPRMSARLSTPAPKWSSPRTGAAT